MLKARQARGRRSGLANSPDVPIERFALPLFFIAVVLLGGASSDASIHAFILQLLCLPCLAYALIRFRWCADVPADEPVIGLALLFLVLVLVQLVPLAPAAWTSLPGRNVVVQAFDFVGLERPWFPLTLNAQGTLTSFLAVVPVATLLLLVGRVPQLPVRAVGRTLCGLAILSLLVGLLQYLSGPGSALYIHPITNAGMAVGFFANANHFATSLLISLPLAAVLIGELRDRRILPGLRIAIFLGYALCVAGGLYPTSSNAGAALWLPTTAASCLLLLQRIRPSAAGVIGLTLLAICAVSLIAWQSGKLPILMDENLSDAPGTRATLAYTTWAAIMRFWPVGSGLGTFEQVFPMFEDPALVTNAYANHAHNDYLEILLELGFPGILLLALGLLWWTVRTFQAWQRTDAESIWPRAASIVLGIVLVHSTVDYPARTPAIMTISVFFILVLATVRKQPATDGEIRVDDGSAAAPGR